MILIAGASSKPGQRLIPMLVQKGYRVRALTRTPQKLEFANSLGVDVVEGDMRQPDTLLRACEGAEAVVSTVTAIGENLLCEVDGEGNQLLMEIAQRSGVKRFVHVSAYGAARNHPVDFFRIKFEAEEHLRSMAMNYTILRPTCFMESWCARIGAQVLRGETVTIFGNGKNPINFISVEDVAKYIVLALEDPRMCNQTLTIGGPQNLTLTEVAAIYERLAGINVPKQYVPAWKVYILSRLYSISNKSMSHIMALRHYIVTSNWKLDVSELTKTYPVNTIDLESLSKEMSTR